MRRRESLQCEVCGPDRTTHCGDCGKKYLMISKKELRAKIFRKLQRSKVVFITDAEAHDLANELVERLR